MEEDTMKLLKPIYKWPGLKMATALSLAAFTAAAAAPLDLESLTRGRRLMLGNTHVRVEPEREARLVAPMAGVLKMEIEVREGLLPEGSVIGVLDQGRMELEERLLQLEVARAEGAETAEWRLDHQTRKTALQDKLQNLDRQLDLLARVEKDPEISKLYVGSDKSAPDGSSAEAFEKKRARLQHDADLIRAVLDNAENVDMEAQHVEIEEIKRKQRALDHDRRRNLSTLRMPFEGRFRLLQPWVQGQQELRVEAGQELAVIQDTRRFYASVPVQSANWRGHSKEDLVLEILLNPNDLPLEGRYHEEREIVTRGQPELVWVFAFPEERSEVAGALAGGFVPSTLWLDLGEPVRMISKLELAVNHPDVFRSHDWTAGVRQVFSNAGKVVVGATHLAIHPKIP